MSQFFASGVQSIGVSASKQALPNEHSERISFTIDWLDLLAVQGTLKSPLDCKEVHPVHPKGDQPWVLIGRTDAEAETPVPWTPHAKS